MPGLTVVVGAAQGIGEDIARHLASLPWTGRVVLADRNLPLVQQVARDLAGQGQDAEAMEVDIADPRSIQRLADATGEAERVALVAGIFKATPSLDVEPDEFHRILAVNLTGTFFTAQAYARRMVERGDGSIVAVASIASRMPRMRQAAYCASKAGMRQALRVLALETVPAGVRINFVSPGPTDSPMMRELAADHPVDDLAVGSPPAFRPRIPDGRVGRGSDVAASVAFLMSPEAAHIAMHDLYVDGGESLGI
jgi:2,3-dihydro-2,3-dihydroxybenzoate dehydrogenase